MSKIKIEKDDINRVLLTEMLPYEVPMFFSNEGFYNIIKSNIFYRFKEKIKRLKGLSEFSIPFTYEIRKENNDSRVLGIIHPLNQIPFIDFYRKYDSVIVHLCSKSPFSLRRVSRVAKFCYSPDLVFPEDQTRNAELEVEPDVLDKETMLLKSYFTYHPVDLIYKFYEKRDYLRLEQRFSKLLEFDISKCFYNIYTHSITWAVKEKEFSKLYKGASSFENNFDKLMQQANYNETNGIVVGPEISRIFAEIILQQIDINVLKKLESPKFGLVLSRDYEIRRYVDDYFIFSNDEKTLDVIYGVYKQEIEVYKLYINKAKTQKRGTPFISNIGVAKREIQKLFETLTGDITFAADPKDVKNSREPTSVNNANVISRNFIMDFQCIVKKNNLSYDVVNKEVIRSSKQLLIEVLKGKKDKLNKSNIENFLFIILDISFYCYSVNINSSTTFKIAQIIVLICKYLKVRTELDLKHSIYRKISKEADFVITIYQNKKKESDTNIEALNLLVALSILDNAYLLSPNKISELFRLKSDQDYQRLNYFQIVILLYYIQNFTQFETIKAKVEDAVRKKFLHESDPFSKSEYTLLFFDFICCPFVSKIAKRRLLWTSKWESSNEEAVLDLAIKEIEDPKKWFMNWDAEIDLEGILKKKEWGSSY